MANMVGSVEAEPSLSCKAHASDGRLSRSIMPSVWVAKSPRRVQPRPSQRPEIADKAGVSLDA